MKQARYIKKIQINTHLSLQIKCQFVPFYFNLLLSTLVKAGDICSLANDIHITPTYLPLLLPIKNFS